MIAHPLLTQSLRNGRWRSQYLYDPSSGSLSGGLKVDVHYYEDGNVRLTTDKPVSASISSTGNASDVVRQIMQVERKYQEDLNRAFASLSEGAFKSLRRQLPVTRQKIEWDKISGYRVSLVSRFPPRAARTGVKSAEIRLVGSRHWWWTIQVI